MNTTAQLKQHEQQIIRLTSSLERLRASKDIDTIQSEIEDLLSELSSELQQAEQTILELNPVKSRMLVTPEARQLSNIRSSRKKILKMMGGFNENP